MALLHLYDLNDEREQHTIWSAAEGGDGGDIYPEAAVALDHTSGLRVSAMPEIADTTAKAAHGPQIGCPASMVRGYIEKLHHVSATASLEAELIRVE
jgi:hypothetical protein